MKEIDMHMHLLLDVRPVPKYYRRPALSLAGAATSIFFVATNTCLSRQNTSFVVTKVFVATNVCCHKHVFVATSMLLSRQKKCFVATKMILVAAPANDTALNPLKASRQ